MELFQKFLAFVKYEKLFKKQEQVLLAVSGGMDSIVMTELFHKAKFNFAIAHCNFGLRGKESDADEQFVKALAKKYKVDFFSVRFETKMHAKEHGLSIQEAARDLRYEWFFNTMSKQKIDFCATAHHLNDSIETFFINLLRGTGISGLAGIIPITEDNLIRPLLFATRRDIENFVSETKLTYREDSSNHEDKYLRNRIRHHLMPLLEKMNPSYEKVMTRNLHNLQFAEYIYEKSMIEETINCTHHIGGMPYFSRRELRRLEFPVDYLYEFLNPFEFNAAQVQKVWDSKQSGKVFYTTNFRVVCDRDKIILQFHRKKDDGVYKIKTNQELFTHTNFKLHLSKTLLKSGKKFVIPANPEVSSLDLSLLKFPLKVRKWEAGDSFYPLGMKHRKKVSDFLVDNKFSLPEKDNVYVLLSENNLVCLLGLRIDNRYKVTAGTKKVYRIHYLSTLK